MVMVWEGFEKCGLNVNIFLFCDKVVWYVVKFVVYWCEICMMFIIVGVMIEDCVIMLF